MVLQHFALTHYPLGKAPTELWDDGPLARLQERFQWLLESPGVGVLSGEPGVGKTTALRSLTAQLNPHRYQVVYLAETDFGRLDLYRSLALALGWSPSTAAPPCGAISRPASRSWPTAKGSCRCGSSTRRRTCPWSSSAICPPSSTSPSTPVT